MSQIDLLVDDKAPANPIYQQTRSAWLNQERTSLLQQAMYLVDQWPNMATAIDYNTVALVNVDANQPIIADGYFRKAISAAKGVVYQALARRSYAAFLFTQRSFQDGRQEYEQAVALLKGSDNVVRSMNALTFQMWAWSEANFAGSPTRAQELRESTLNEINGIDNASMREDTLSQLRMMQ
jgi:hypothetical protein